MNKTIERIVELTFDRAAPTQEMRELKEEVLANCQAHYEDLIAQGRTPDEATEAVVESLRGMEELIQADDTAADGSAFEKHAPPVMLELEPANLRRVRMELTSADVEVNAGDRFQLDVTNGNRSRIESRMEGDTLVLRQVKFTEDGADSRPEGLLRWLQISFLPHDSCSVSMTLPRGLCPEVSVQTRSGDITWTAGASSLMLSTVSGDVEARLPGGASLSRAQLQTANGDIEAAGAAENWRITTVNGDVDAQISGEALTCTTTNGDVDLTAALRRVEISTVSGDQDVRLSDPACTQIALKAVSGDLSLSLPAEITSAALQTHTLSGNVELTGVANDPAAPCRITLNTVSGDLEVTH